VGSRRELVELRGEPTRIEEECMRRVVYSVAASLDGYIAGTGGEFDWIPEEPEIDWAAFMGRFDTALMGRGTYEVMVDPQTRAVLPEMRVYVFSRTLRAADHPQVTVIADNVAQVVTGLREQPGKDIWLVGGGVLFRSLLEAGLVDVVEVAVVPILLGQGLALLPPVSRRTRLALVDSRVYPSGIVLLTYHVVG
jgi:dihydrofolate reductase